MRRAARAILSLCPILAIGCPNDPPAPETESVLLADGSAWARVGDPAVDVFADQRPADAVCDDSGYALDPLTKAVEIATEVCDYLTLAQPTLVALEPGDVVIVQAYHDMLSAPAPAEGYLGIALAGEIEWEYQVAIPSGPVAIEQEFTVDRPIPAGSEIQVHVHNHGPNSWELVSVRALVDP